MSSRWSRSGVRLRSVSALPSVPCQYAIFSPFRIVRARQRGMCTLEVHARQRSRDPPSLLRALPEPRLPRIAGSLCEAKAFVALCDGEDNHLPQFLIRRIVGQIHLVEAGVRCRERSFLVSTMKAVEFDPSVGAQSGKGGRPCNVRHNGELGVALNSLQCSKPFQPIQGETRENGENG